jgi:ubiquinone/menaquinone biosynthesis C-methylase UbiE
VVVPKWASLFGRALLTRVRVSPRDQVLDLACGSGHPSLELLKRLPDGARIIAVDSEVALIDIARRRAHDDAGRRIFFKAESPERLGFGNDVFDVAMGNLVLGRSDSSKVLAEVARVLVPGGRAVFTRALRGTFEEVLDMFRELVVRAEDTELAQRLLVLESMYPTPAQAQAELEQAGFEDVSVRVEDHRLPFHNARELFSDPLVQFLAMPEWTWLAGASEKLDEVRRALDTYFANGPISLTVRAGVIDGQRPGERNAPA